MAATNDDNNTQIYMQLNIYPSQYIYTGNRTYNYPFQWVGSIVCNHIARALHSIAYSKQTKQTKQTEIWDFNTWFPHVYSILVSLHFAAVWFLSSKNLIPPVFFILLVAFCLQCRFRKNMLISVEEAYKLKADILLSGFV